jgi:hypothetical protein
MVDLKNKKCISCNKTQPNFGYENDNTPTYCSKCKLKGMIDLKNKKCISCNKIRASCSYENDKTPTYCSKCKLKGMVDLLHKKCISCNKIRPNFGYENDKIATYCGKCKLPNMIDIGNKSKKCKNEWCDTQVADKYDGYCWFCYVNMFPDKPVSRRYKSKENEVLQFIKQEFDSVDIVSDRTIEGGCSRRRPDIFIDLGYQIVIVEIDENQHQNYDCTCENKRLMQISVDVEHRPIIFIRFNPDDYIDKNNKNVTSCWYDSKVKKTKSEEWKNRLSVLKNTLTYWFNNENKIDKIVEVVHLFYDEN